MLGSIAAINSLHSHLLITHRVKPDLTISERAANNTFVHRLYILGHFVGGLLFGIFAWYFFVQRYQTPILFVLTTLGIIAEWTQALVPARDIYEKYHITLAYAMSVIMTVLGIAAALLLPIDGSLQRTVLFIALLILLGYPAALLLPRRYFWKVEMININLFYLQMLLLYLGR